MTKKGDGEVLRSACELRGTLFEAAIGNYLQKSLEPCYVRYDKTFFSKKLSKPTAIDVLVVTAKFILVVEAKNWSDWIRGTINDFHWLGSSRSKSTMKVISPYWQNFNHVRVLRNAVTAKGHQLPPVLSLIVVPDGTTIETDCDNVCHFSEMMVFIDRMSAGFWMEYNKDKVLKAIMGITGEDA